MEKLIEKFCNRKYLKKNHPSLRLDENNETNRQYVYIDDLLIIIRFLGFMKFEYNRPNNRNHIFIRGQIDDFAKMTPSIFRGEGLQTDKIENRIKAYKKIKEEIYRLKRVARFRGEIGGASLQHYGVNTPWLDLVDNIFIALWFARNEMKKLDNQMYEIKKSVNEFGWIYLLKTEYNNNINPEGLCIGTNTQWCDLRYHHRDLSLRPHFQHGILLSKSQYSVKDFDLNEEVIATIKFPVHLQNDFHDFSTEQIFPCKKYDNTFKYLTDPIINQMIYDVEKEFGLKEEEMGRIFNIKYKNGC